MGDAVAHYIAGAKHKKLRLPWQRSEAAMMEAQMRLAAGCSGVVAARLISISRFVCNARQAGHLSRGDRTADRRSSLERWPGPHMPPVPLTAYGSVLTSGQLTPKLEKAIYCAFAA